MHGASLPVFVSVSESHRSLVDRFLLPSFERSGSGRSSELILAEAPQLCESGRFGSSGWRSQTRLKLELARQACERVGDGGLFACADADILFLGEWAEEALRQMGGAELAAMADPRLSSCFYVARATPQVRRAIDLALERWGEWPGDSAALRDCLSEVGAEVVLLDRRFANPGILGAPLPLQLGQATFSPPHDALVFHANFCALEDKAELLAEVERIHSGGERLANDRIVTQGPEGEGFFPSVRPDRPFDRQSMFSSAKARDVLRLVDERPVKVIVEIGSWLGASTRWLLETFTRSGGIGSEHEYARIFCIDTWGGLPEWEGTELEVRASVAWEQFAVNCWHLRQWITPVRLPSRNGIHAVAHRLQLQDEAPDLVFIDGDHSYQGALQDILLCAQAWPDALLLGDDYHLDGTDPVHGQAVRAAVREASVRLGRRVRKSPSGIWSLTPDPLGLALARGRRLARRARISPR